MGNSLSNGVSLTASIVDDDKANAGRASWALRVFLQSPFYFTPNRTGKNRLVAKKDSDGRGKPESRRHDR